ncbi:MAG: TetR/AcrR family transcriptional regulator [Alphaproteobacteria bacterium]|nr:TetR/AcrR family transcriptional regulator [Alphaproteobacteria bacterium]
MNSRDGRRKPLQKRSIEKVQLILDAVDRLVVIHGTEALTTTHVAEETGFAVGTIYQYFGNRADLLIAAHDRLLERLAAGVTQAAARLDAFDEDSVEKLIRLFVDNARENPSYISLLNFAYLNKTYRHTDVVADDFIGDLVSHIAAARSPDISPADLQVRRIVTVNVLTILTNVLLLEEDGRLQERYLQEMVDHCNLALNGATSGDL